MVIQIFIFAAALVAVMQGATLSTKYSALLARSFHLSQYTIGFIVVAVISIFPETFISLNAVHEGIPAFGFGMLIGSNVADLTLIIALVTFIARRPLRVESKILVSQALYPFLLLIPIVLGLDGHLSRVEGAALIITGLVFYILTLKHTTGAEARNEPRARRARDIFFLMLGIALLLLGSQFIVSSATTLALMWGVSPVLIGMLVVGLGTTIPEFSFSIHAIKHAHDSLALGDILGTVLADATIVVGILALIAPFTFPTTIIYVAGVFMVSAAFILFSFMRSGKMITGREGFALIVLWVTFVIIECIVNI